jgi:hypothetical protein
MRHLPGTVADLDQMVELVAAGMTIQAACASLGFHPLSYKEWLRRRPKYRARFAAAEAARTEKFGAMWRGKFRTPAEIATFEAALEALQNTTDSQKSVLTRFGLTYANAQQYCATRPDFSRRWKAAVARHRERIEFHRSDFVDAIRMVAANPEKPLIVLLQASVPSYMSIRVAAQRDPGLNELLRDAMRQRRCARKIGAKKYAADHRECWRVAQQHAPRYLNHADRQDVASELFLELAVGTTRIDRARERGLQLAAKLTLTRRSFTSLDDDGGDGRSPHEFAGAWESD